MHRPLGRRVFSATACRDLVRNFDEDEKLRRIMAGTGIFATEEIVLPTLVALHGHEILRNPCSHDHLRYNVLFTQRQLQSRWTIPASFGSIRSRAPTTTVSAD